MQKKRIVVTGIGSVSPLGLTSPSAFAAAVAGKSGIAPLEGVNTDGLNTNFGGQLKDFDASKFMPAKEVRRYDAFVPFAVAASSEALAQSKLLDDASLDKSRVSVCIGSGIGGLNFISDGALRLEEAGTVKKVSPFLIPGSISNIPSGYVSIEHGFTGPNLAVTTACATSAHSIALAARMLQYGDADVAIAGGAECSVSRLGIACFNACRALSTQNEAPQKASAPWDQSRDGFVMSEGAAVLVLETWEHAKNRGASVLAELVGVGMSGDAYHITSPHEEGLGAAQAMRVAIKDAGIAPVDLDYINAHGTSTPLGDLAEAKAIARVYEESGSDVSKVAISSTKSTSGHLLGAAGALEAALSIHALKENIIPPTINLHHPDEALPKGMDLVPLKAREKSISLAMSNSFGFGGTNVSLVFKEAD